jgi:acetyl esterase
MRTLARGLFALPDPALRVLAGKVPQPAAGLEPDAWLLARFAALGRGPLPDRPPAELRAGSDSVTAFLSLRGPKSVAVRPLVLPGPGGPLRARLYVPRGAPRPGPLLVYCHGGGWVFGSLVTHENSCRLLAQLAGVRVLAIDYRLAPEHPFPAATEDALAAYAYAAARHAELEVDPARLALGGDSAGGNLAAVAAQAVHADPGLPDPAMQLLLYPPLDMSRVRESRRSFGEGFALTEQSMVWYENRYVPDPAQRSDPRVSPLLAPSLEGLAPAYIATCVADPLRDEGEEYAALLRAAGVPVTLERQPLIHGFFNLTVLRSARRALGDAAVALRRGLA